jgi:hypothetical protein
MSNLLKKKNEDEKSITTTLKTLKKKIEILQKQNDEVREKGFNPVLYIFFLVLNEICLLKFMNKCIFFIALS